MAYTVTADTRGWYVRDGGGAAAAGPFPTLAQAEARADQLDAADAKVRRRGERPASGCAVVAGAVAGTVVCGAVLGLAGAVAYKVFRLLTGV